VGEFYWPPHARLRTRTQIPYYCIMNSLLPWVLLSARCCRQLKAVLSNHNKLPTEEIPLLNVRNSKFLKFLIIFWSYATVDPNLDWESKVHLVAGTIYAAMNFSLSPNKLPAELSSSFICETYFPPNKIILKTLITANSWIHKKLDNILTGSLKCLKNGRQLLEFQEFNLTNLLTE